MLNISSYKVIIFDLGGVILNINYQATIESFQKLQIPNFEALYTQAKQNQIFDRLETGHLSNTEFRNYIRDKARIELTDQQIDSAWNAMLLDLPNERIKLLEEIKQAIPIFLLSNTNAIHLNWFQQYLAEHFQGFESFNNLFKGVYYSNHIGLRKPDRSMFQKVLQDNNLDAENTLFIDDSLQHIEAASKLRIQTHHLHNESLVNILSA